MNKVRFESDEFGKTNSSLSVLFFNLELCKNKLYTERSENILNL